MEFITILPDDPMMFEHPMVKFKIITDNHSISFVVKGKFSEKLLRNELDDVPAEDMDKIIQLVSDYYTEEKIGETEFSEITSMVKIERILQSEDQTK